MLSLLNLYCHGYVAIPILESCAKRGLFKLLNVQKSRHAAWLVKELGAKTTPTYHSDLAKISVVGVGMRVHTGVAQRMFKALADAKINIQNITTSEIKISCIIAREDGARALQIVHDAFELEKAT